MFGKNLWTGVTFAAALAAESGAVLDQGLVAYYPFSGTFENSAGTEIDPSENHGATFATDRFGNENSSAYFDGNETYLEIPDNDAFSISTTGALTISVWVSPEVLNFPNSEAGGYVHWMGKGVPHQHEWVFRMYNKDLSQGQEDRPNRMSAYAFNLEGGLGAGSYVQEQVQENEWIHFVARYDVETNKITLFKNGVQKDQDDLHETKYNVQVQNGTAPLRLGTRSQWSYFQGRIDDLRIYNRALSESEILELFNEPDAKASNTETEEQSENQEESQALRNGPRVLEKPKANFGKQKFYDLKGRRVP